MGHLNPYVWGADSLRGVATITRLHVSNDPEKRAQAEQITRAAQARFNAEGTADQRGTQKGR